MNSARHIVVLTEKGHPLWTLSEDETELRRRQVVLALNPPFHRHAQRQIARWELEIEMGMECRLGVLPLFLPLVIAHPHSNPLDWHPLVVPTEAKLLVLGLACSLGRGGAGHWLSR